jgi:anti-anti-sigma regulatory factor
MASANNDRRQQQLQQYAPDGTARLEVAGELTVANIADFHQRATVQLLGCSRAVIDLTAAEYLDASAFQYLAMLRKQLALQHIGVTLESIPAAVLADATMLGMDSVLTSPQSSRTD